MDEFTHGGHVRHLSRIAGCACDALVDFSANINPSGPPVWFQAEMAATMDMLAHYPDPYCQELCEAGAERFGIAAQEVVAGNGSTEILYTLIQSLDIRQALIAVPCYTDYERACRVAEVPVEYFPLVPHKDFAVDFHALAERLDTLLHSSSAAQTGTAVFLAQPNNPTGQCFDVQACKDLAQRYPQVLFIIDEAFADFVPELDRLAAQRPDNVIVLFSLTKMYAIPGLRLGLAFARPDRVSAIRRYIPPWSVNALAQAVGIRALADTAYLRQSVTETRRLRKGLRKNLQSINDLTVYPGEANFLLCHLGRTLPDAQTLADALLAENIAIRVCSSFQGLDQRYIRLAVRGDEENAQLLAALDRVLDLSASSASRTVARAGSVRKKRRTPALMLQGTSSNAGKSVLAAALGRILWQDGVRVVPFKAQNMSLNSFVTHEGGEMGRAQVTQAQACRLDPDVRMNPVLLKPSSHTGSQVIVMGRPVGNMQVAEYIRYKPTAFTEAKAAYDALSSEYDAVILEGAGSPAEINLKQHDIVNMQMARYAAARALLVGDIDRGGVFASFIGTVDCMEPWERRLMGGFLINCFRGDASLLDPALSFTSTRTGIPFLGVVPHIAGLGLPEEDSVSFKASLHDRAGRQTEQGSRASGHIPDIVCIDLPHIANFTDLDALIAEPDIAVRIVRQPSDLGTPHVLILPGSKNIVADMEFLRSSGLADAVVALARKGTGENATEIIGICGGLQMLGHSFSDPHGLESSAAQSPGVPVPGLDLLAIHTTLVQEKTLTLLRSRHETADKAVTGYEVHHGKTALLPTKSDSGTGSTQPIMYNAQKEPIGFASNSGRVWGSYLHGIFDSDEYRHWFINNLRVRHKLPPPTAQPASYTIEPALDRLAEVVRTSIDMDRIYSLLGL